MCTWQDGGLDVAWSRHHGPSNPPYTGPPGDHTLGLPIGNYLLLNASAGTPGTG